MHEISATIAPMSLTTSRPQSWFVHRVDTGLIATLLFCLFTLWPLLQQPGLPNGTDTLYHTYRVAEMDRAWSHGLLIPTWAEAFYYGYGSPVFHYYASLTYYVTSLLSRLFGFSALDSLRALIVLCMLLAGGGMYLFLRDEMGSPLSGILAALVYVYSPYILFTEPYTRGAFPELLALAWFPLVMWRYSRLLQTGRGLALAAVSGGILIITHNLMALVLTGLLAAWLGWQLITRQVKWQRFIAGSAALIAGIGLAAYFWLPVILEQDGVRLGNLTAIAQLDYRNFFVPLGELLAFSPRPDAGAINGLLHQLNLGVAQWTLALIGIIGIIGTLISEHLHQITPTNQIDGVGGASQNNPDRVVPPLQAVERGLGGEVNIKRMKVSTIFFSLMTLIIILLMLPQAEIVWQAAAPLAFLQFPWRFLGPTAFCLAVLAGYNAHWLEKLPSPFRNLLTVVMLLLPITLALPTLYVDEWEHVTVDTSVAGYHAVELQGLQRATTFSDEYLPTTVVAEPSANADLLADFADGYPLDRANRAALPAGTELTLLDNGPQHATWQVSTITGFTFEALTYYFPGWQATIDGEAATVQPSNPHGLITFEIPAGDHVVHLFLGATPPRQIGIGLSLVTVLGLIITARFARRQTTNMNNTADTKSIHGYYRPLIIAGILQLVIMIGLMREGLAWVNSPPGTAQIAQHQITYNLGEQIQLLGYDLNTATLRPGDRLELVVYWYGREPIDYGYATFVHVSTGGPPVAQADKQNPAGRPTLEWTPDGYIRDEYTIDLPADLAPGEYQLMVGLYTCETRPPGECGNGDRLPVTNAAGESLGDTVPLTMLTVR